MDFRQVHLHLHRMDLRMDLRQVYLHLHRMDLRMDFRQVYLHLHRMDLQRVYPPSCQTGPPRLLVLLRQRDRRQVYHLLYQMDLPRVRPVRLPCHRKDPDYLSLMGRRSPVLAGSAWVDRYPRCHYLETVPFPLVRYPVATHRRLR